MKKVKTNNPYLKALFVSLILLVLIRIAAPFVVQNYVNTQIENTEGITGYIGNVDLNLFKGGYAIDQIKIYEVDELSATKPLLSIKRLSFSVSWSALLKGNVVSTMNFTEPVIVIYDKKPNTSELSQQVKDETTWVGLANDLVPFSIDSLNIDKGKVTLINEETQNEESTYLSNINGEIANITNAQNLSETLVTSINVNGALMGQAQLTLNGKLDPFSEQANFDFNLEVERFSVNYLDSVFAFYTPFDIEGGSLDGAMELAARENNLTGYAKAGVYNLSIFSWREDIEKDDDGLFTFIFEGASQLLSDFLKNDDSELIAARIPIEGELNNTDISTLQAVISVLKNAFFDAFEMDIDDVITFESVESEKDESN